MKQGTVLYFYPQKAAVVVSSGPIKFDEFTLDCERYELQRGSDNIRLEKIPMELLILLVTKRGNLVTRQDIIDHLWGKDVFVDTEHGINTAIRKIRQALKDDSDKPRFVQTVTGKGYRFIAECGNGRSTIAMDAVEPDGKYAAEKTRKASKIRPYWISSAITALGVLLVSVIVVELNIGGLRNRIFSENQIGPIHSIAVLPLTNLSGDPSQEYFADGMTDEMITALAENHSLRVVSRTSAMQFKGVNKPLREIAQSLGVDGILEGSVIRTNDKVHVNLQLIYAPTDTHVWAQSYNRDLKDAIYLPGEISQIIAAQAKVPATPIHQRRYINPEAHEAYLRGRFFWFAFNLPKSIGYFQKAIQLQPDYAAAWDGLGDVYGAQAVIGQGPPRETLAKAEGFIQKALQLDDSLAEAHTSMAALCLFYKWDWQCADAESLQATELNPNYAEGHHVRSYALMVLNRSDEALQEQKRSTEIDPYSRPWALGSIYIQLRRYDEAIDDLKLRSNVLPDSDVAFYLSEAYWHKGMWKESEDQVEKGWRLRNNDKMAEALHRAFERGGEKAVEKLGVNDILELARKQYVRPLDIARSYAFSADKKHVLKYLDIAYQEHAPWIVFLQNDPLFDFLHSDPHYRAIVRDIGLPPAW